MIQPWHEEAITKQHNRDAFDCGIRELNDYLKKFARQNHESGGAKTILAIDDNDHRILGFYTLAPTAAQYNQTPEHLRKGLPRHDIPGFRLARLALDISVQGKGLGTQLFLAAGRRCLKVAGEIGGFALFIDAKNEHAANWYESLGAECLQSVSDDFPRPMMIPLKTIETALNLSK